jgi:hypothetical protein
MSATIVATPVEKCLSITTPHRSMDRLPVARRQPTAPPSRSVSCLWQATSADGGTAWPRRTAHSARARDQARIPRLELRAGQYATLVPPFHFRQPAQARGMEQMLFILGQAGTARTLDRHRPPGGANEDGHPLIHREGSIMGAGSPLAWHRRGNGSSRWPKSATHQRLALSNTPSAGSRAAEVSGYPTGKTGSRMIWPIGGSS